MHEIDIAQDQLDYVGLLAAPAFRLFTSPAALASGLYHAFQGFHSGTDAITFEGTSRSRCGRRAPWTWAPMEPTR